MEVSSMLVFFFFFFSLLVENFQISESATMVVDGITEWRNPTVQIGDTVIFQHKYQHHNLYIFKNQRAFNLCNFTQATLLSNPDSPSYTWHTSRTGFFYFSFNNGSMKDCLEGQKLAVKVTLLSAVSPPPPETQPSLPGQPPSVAEPPQVTGGGIVSSSPAFPWPFRPKEETAAASPSPSPSSAMFPAKSGHPFINSNPAVPLPTGEVDSATIRPFPISGTPQRRMVRALFWVIFLMLLQLL